MDRPYVAAGAAVKGSVGGTRATMPLDGTRPLQDLLPEIRKRLQAKGRK
jgi:hypothetical protein